jgi:ABC-2 type transport system ATP-binding protein
VESKLENILTIVGLYDERDKKYKGYSFGMRQKLGIACAIMDEPDVLILDEPFNGIDYESSDMIRNHLKEYVKNDKIVIISTHIKDDLSNLCDEVYQVDEGVLIKT